MKQMLTLKETEKYLSLQRDAIMRAVHRGELRATKLGRDWRFSVDWLDDYIAMKEEQTRQELNLA